MVRSITCQVISPRLTTLGNISYTLQGDVYLGVMFDLSDATKDRIMLPLSVKIQTLYTYVYSVNQINNNSTLLPNISLGLIAMDLKGSLSGSVARSLQFTPALTEECQQLLLSERRKVAGVIGPLNSAQSKVTAPIFSLYEIPQISPLASSDELSNKRLYPYFFRIAPPDRLVAQAIADTLKYFNWTYIYFFYDESVVGLNAYKESIKSLRKVGVCLAEQILVTNDFTEDDFDRVVKKMLNDRRGHVVITTFRYDYRLHQSFKKHNLEHQVIWGTAYCRNTFINSWISHGLGNLILGSFNFIYVETPIPGLIDYLGNLTLSKDTGNVWLQHYFEKEFDCIVDGNMSNSCDNYQMSNTKDLPSPFRPQHQVNAVYAFAYALDALIRKDCPEAFNDPSLLDSCVRPYALKDIMKEVTVHSPTHTFKFDSNGDLGYDLVIQQLQLTNKSGSPHYTYMNIGIWNHKTHEVIIDWDLVNWDYFHWTKQESGVPESLCGKPCQYGEAIIQGEQPCCWTCFRCRNNEVITDNGTMCTACPSLTWPNETTFENCIIIPPTYLTWSDPYAIGLCGLAGLGLISALAIICLVIKYRERRVIKGASWELTLVTLIGLTMSFVTVMFFIAKATFVICIFGRIGFNISCTLIFGPLLVKTNRIFQVFRAANKLSRKVFIGGKMTQIIIICVIQCIQVSECCIIIKKAHNMLLILSMLK